MMRNKKFQYARYYKLDLDQLKNAQEIKHYDKDVNVSLPTLEERSKRFSISSFLIVVPSLAAKYNFGSMSVQVLTTH